MAKRKSKKPQQEDTSILLDSSGPQSRAKTSSFASPAWLLVVTFAAGASVMGWFCVQQQHSLDQLTESFTAMQDTITTLQQVGDVTGAQTDTDLDVEERIFALEEAQKQAQERAEVALATSEKLKNSGLYLQLSDLQDEIDIRLAEIKQATLSVTTLQAMFKNQSEEFEAVKQSVVAGLSSGSALAENVAVLTDAVAGVFSRVDAQVASAETVNAQLDRQASELNELKESMHLHNVALYTNNQEMAAIKELVEAKQVMYAQALEEMLSSVQVTLDEQFVTSQTLRSSVMAQLQSFHTQLASAPSVSMKSNEEGSAAEEFIPTTAQDATEEEDQLEDEEEQAEQQDAEDEAEEEAEEEEEEEEEEADEEEETEEEEAMQEEQPLEQEVDGDIAEKEVEEDIIEEEEEITEEEEEITEEEEEMTPEEQEDEDITGLSEEQEVAEETEDILDESLEEELSEDVVESWETVEEESAELNSEVFMDGNEEDE